MSEVRKAEYDAILDKMDLKALVKEFFTYLDYTESKGIGMDGEDHTIRPITIGCCRVLMAPCLEEVMKRLRKEVDAL